MKCYVCARNGVNREAIGICAVCGMGVCEEHSHYEEETFWRHGFPIPIPQENEPKTLKRLLCLDCYAAIRQMS